VQDTGGLRRVYPALLPTPLRLILGTVAPVDSDSTRGALTRGAGISAINKNEHIHPQEMTLNMYVSVTHGICLMLYAMYFKWAELDSAFYGARLLYK
jgi:hypothetical protein